MNAEEYKTAVLDVAYLAAAAVNGKIPDAERVKQMNLDNVYAAAERHLLGGIIAMALESAGFADEVSAKAKGNAIRKVILLDADKNAILNRFEEEGIWYLPLKGTILKDIYPAVGMRQMSDIDILIDPERLGDADKIMQEMKYEKQSEDQTNASFHKQPLYHIELHNRLFSPFDKNKTIREYYQNVKDRILPDEGNHFGYRFSDEDFYLYILAHEYKHFSRGGTGLRSLLDTYVYCTRKSLNWDYIRQELEKLNITEFEVQNRSLAMDLFGGKALNMQEEEMLDYMIFSGTYGTITNLVANEIKREGNGLRGRFRYILHRLFLPMEVVESVFPTFAKYPILLPFLPIYRVIRGLINNNDGVKSELKELTRRKDKKEK